MKTNKLNQDLIQKLQSIIDEQSTGIFIERFNLQASKEQQKQGVLYQKRQLKNENPINKRLISKSRQRIILRRKQSKKVFDTQLQSQVSVNQNQLAQSYQQAVLRKQIKDRAVYVNVTQIPYLHSTDLLNHLYKKSSTLVAQSQCEVTLFNPPSNNPHMLTKIKYLSIYYCKIESLRDMGTGWSNLVQLSVYFGQLKDLGGLNAFPSIEYLHCPFNSIQSISEVMFHPTLASIDLESNNIQDFTEVQHLFTVQSLEYINLLNNPVYLNKQNKRKINQKFQKIIQLQFTRFDDYLNQKQREKWELQQVQQLQYCNSLMKQFFQQTKEDDITVQKKHQYKTKITNQNISNDCESVIQNQTNGQNTSPSQVQKELKIEYIPAQIPDGTDLQQMLFSSKTEQNQNGTFCQQKLSMTPLLQMLDINQIYVGPVFNKYLMGKLSLREDNTKEKKFKNPQRQNKLLSKDQTDSQIKASKIKRISRMVMTGVSGLIPDNNLQQSNKIQQKVKQFQKTTTSLSTNCTNLNSTTTNFPFRRTKLSLSKSKQKSLNKISLIAKISENMANTHSNSIANTPTNNINASTLSKHSRLLLGRPQRLKEVEKQSIERKFDKSLNHIGEQPFHSIQKMVFSTTLKNKATLSGHRRQRSLIMHQQKRQNRTNE